MRWLLRSRTLSVVIRHGSHNSFEPCRSVVTSCRPVLLPRFGGPEVLEVQETVNLPELKPNEVLVRARVVSVNPLDTRMRSSYGSSLFEPLLPLILGRDSSGEVASLGSSVHSLSVGQEVFGTLHPTAVSGSKCHPFCFLDCLACTEMVLVVGGEGAVCFSAIQLAVAVGCHVSSTCGGECIPHILAAGAEQAVDYTTEDYEASTNGYFDAVMDSIGVAETERIGVSIF